MDDKILKIKELIETRYSAVACGYTEERSMGNSTDVFEDGCNCGESHVLYEIGCILGMDLKEPEEQEYDF
ncbi:hypothetical protein SECTIM467_120 [Brevibacillus phage SecTim467]|uniref:Uncharacterized protein n=2 Tax=Jenstvirus jenst TaxID=1982225 RepID=A0A0K2CPB1_9CAUD|nr:hypothetical protein AVV11_gp076 [Brevibacillus phage Jenst]ALA07244.1 hypothetical protein JENST_115 [Brevibacillus phage Jenst]ALA07568.1 hypothetical protein SECTIM467_120 [Brevibacillus phage SecTim467]